MAKMLARDLHGSKFACGCCQEYADNRKGRTQSRRTARRREKQAFKRELDK